MGKTVKGKAKTATKVARAKAKIARKAKGCSVVLAAFALSFALTGCMGTQTPSRSQSLTIKDCTIKVYGCGTETNEVPRIELATQAMRIKNSGTETQTATPTQTTDVKPDVNLNYAQGGGITNRGTGGAAASGASGILEKLLGTLTDESVAALKSALANKTNGTVTLTKKDGTTVTAECKDGACTFADGTTVTAEDCAACTECSADGKK